MPSEEELIDEPNHDKVNTNDVVSSSICDGQEDEGESSFVTAAEIESRTAALSPTDDEEWEEVVRRAKERDEEELVEEEEERLKRAKREEQARLVIEKKEKKARQQLAKKEVRARANQEKKEEEARLKNERTLEKKHLEKEARKEAELATQEFARREERMNQKRKEVIHATLVKSHEKIAEEMAEQAEVTKKKKEQITAHMAIDLRRRLDLARGLAGSSSG